MTTANYAEFIASRRFTDIQSGFDVAEDQINLTLKPHQKYLVRRARRAVGTHQDDRPETRGRSESGSRRDAGRRAGR